ncbi:hypothetical protein ACFL2B_01480 [Patescibacteria group bacterium]
MQKRKIKAKIVLVISAILMCALSFYAGRLSLRAASSEDDLASIETEEDTTSPTPVSLAMQSGEDQNWHGTIEGEATVKAGEEVIAIDESGKFQVAPGTILTAYTDLFEFTSTLPAAPVAKCPELTPTTATSQPMPVATTPAATGQFVASKNGKKYHPTDSGTAKRIKEENKIFYQTKQAAEAAGYEAGASVK